MNRIGSIAGLCAAVCVASIGVAAGSASAAPDVVGKTYGDAKGILGQQGMSTVVATVIGDRVEQDQCFVVSMTTMTPLDSSGSPAAYNQAQVNLNCYAAQSDKKSPGYSKANNSPEAVATRATSAEARQKWLSSDQGQDWCVESEAEHPDWAPIDGCHSEEEAEAIRQVKWKASPEGQAWCAQAEAEHPEWAPIADCNLPPAQLVAAQPAPAAPAAAQPAEVQPAVAQ